MKIDIINYIVIRSEFVLITEPKFWFEYNGMENA